VFTGLVQQMGTVRDVDAGDTTRLVIVPDSAWDSPYEHGETHPTGGASGRRLEGWM